MENDIHAFPGRRSQWRGFQRFDFTLIDRLATVVTPHRVAAGAPWIWRAQYFDHRPEVDLQLLGLGFHLIFLDDPDPGIELRATEFLHAWDAMYALMVHVYGLSPKVTLEGMSRGGVYMYNWGEPNPEKVACIYADAPVCDIRQWLPHKCQLLDAIPTHEALVSPIDNLEPLARSRVPLLHTCGMADTIVPFHKHTQILADRYRALGGDIQVITRSGIGHEHGLPDPAPILDFIVKRTIGEAATEMPLKNVRRIAFLGDNTVYDGRFVQYLDAYLVTRFPGRRIELVNVSLPDETVSAPCNGTDASGPSIHDRLNRLLETSHADYVVVGYGIHDGMDTQPSDQRFAAFQDGMRRLVEQIQSAGTQVLVLALAVLPSVSADDFRDSTDASGIRDRNALSARCSQWLMQQRARGWNVAGMHTSVSDERVHTDATFQWSMAQAVLEAWGMPVEVDGAGFELQILRANRGHVTQIQVSDDGVSFKWRSTRPMPMDPDWTHPGQIAETFNRIVLKVSDLPAERYDLYEDQTFIATLTREELARGVDVLSLERLSIHRGLADLLTQIRRRHQLVRGAWLRAAGHGRTGGPLEDVMLQVDGMERLVRSLAQPVEMTLSLRMR